MSALAAPSELYVRSLGPEQGRAPRLRARCSDGRVLALDLDRWLGSPAPEEREVLRRARGPVLDVGCGPARHVLALARRGVLAVGIDVAPGAVSFARRRGAPVIEGSIFGPVPGAGTWGSALLLDGNVGIGGDPGVLLARVAELLAPAGRVLLELDPPSVASEPLIVRLECGEAASEWFRWARLGIGALPEVAASAGLATHEVWRSGARWFGELRPLSSRPCPSAPMSSTSARSA